MRKRGSFNAGLTGFVNIFGGTKILTCPKEAVFFYLIPNLFVRDSEFPIRFHHTNGDAPPRHPSAGSCRMEG